jgi:hypothetical protein
MKQETKDKLENIATDLVAAFYLLEPFIILFFIILIAAIFTYFNLKSKGIQFFI